MKLSKLVKSQLNTGSTRDKLNSFFKVSKRRFKSPKSYKAIVPFVLFCTIISLLNIGIPIPFEISNDTILKLLNDRISDFLSIFAIAVAISVFVIQSIQSARLGEEQFSTIFRESGLYPFLYFALTSLGIMNFISFLQDEISPISIANNTVFHGLTVFTTSLVFIGVLFKRIYDFLNTRYLLDAYISNLRFLSEQELHKQAEERLSRTILNDALSKLNLEHLPFHNHSLKSGINISFDSNVVLKDVNLQQLEKIFSQIGNVKGTYSRLGIHQVIFPQETIIQLQSNPKLNQKSIQKIKKQFIVRPFKNQFNELENQKELLLARLLIAASNDDVKSAEIIFSALLGVFESFIEKSKTLNLEKNKNLFAEKDFFDRYWKVTDDLYWGIYSMLEKALLLSNRNVIQAIFTFNLRLLILAINNNSSIVFNEYINTYLSYYSILKQNNKTSEFNSRYFNQLQQVIEFRLIHQFTEIEDNEARQKMNLLIQKGLSLIAIFLKNIVENKDNTNFTLVIKNVHQIMPYSIYEINNKLTEEKWSFGFDSTKTAQDFKELEKLEVIISFPVKLYKALLFGIKSWIFQCYVAQKIDLENTVQFITALKSEPYHSYNSTIFDFNDFIEVIKKEDLLNWRDWDTQEVESGVARFALLPEIWLTRGFVIQLLESPTSVATDLDNIKNDEKFIHIFKDVTHLISRILDNYEEWKSILKFDKAEAEIRANQVINLFQSLKTRAEEIIQETVVKGPLSVKKIEAFNNHIFDAWKRTSIIRHIAQYYNVIKYSEDMSNLLYLPSANTVLWDMKIYFSEREDYSITGFSEYGSALGRGENSEFVKLLLNECKNIRQSSTYEEGLNEIIQHTKGIEAKYDLLMFNSNRGYNLYNNPNFVPQGRNDSKVPTPFFGEYLDIPCISFNLLEYGNFIIGCKLQDNFSLIQGINPDWFKSELNSKVSVISAEESEKLINERPDYWQENSQSKTLEETKEKFHKAILVQVSTKLNFEITDFSKFIIIRVAPEDE